MAEVTLAACNDWWCGKQGQGKNAGDSKVSNQSDGEDGGEVDTMIQDQGPRLSMGGCAKGG